MKNRMKKPQRPRDLLGKVLPLLWWRVSGRLEKRRTKRGANSIGAVPGDVEKEDGSLLSSLSSRKKS